MSGNGPGFVGRLAASLSRAAELASTRFPVAALLIVALSGLANAEVAGISLLPDETLGWWIAAAYAAAVASVLTRLGLEARAARPTVRRLAPLAAALVAGIAVRHAETFGILAPPLVLAFTLAVPLAPYLGRPDDRRFWNFTLWTTVGVSLAFVSVFLFTLGVSAILEMIRFLFDVGLSSRAYEHIYTTALTLVGPLIALGRIPSDFDDAAAVPIGRDRMAQGVRALFEWVAAPLALSAGIVLHLYAAKIVATGELPANEIGWIVTSFAVLVLSMRIAADPFLAGGGVFARGFARVWDLILGVPLSLLAVALARRVGSEGWTLERYYLALGALAALLILLSQIPRGSRGRIRLIAAVPLALLLVSSFGPLGAADTVGRSQAGRMALLVSEAGAVRPDAAAEARSRIGALSAAGELARLVPLLPAGRQADARAALEGSAAGTEDVVRAALGADVPSSAAEPRLRIFASARPSALSVAGFDWALPDRTVLRQGGDARDAEGIAAYLDGPDLVLSLGDATDRFPLRPVVDAVPVGAFETEAAATAPVDAETSSPSGRVLGLRLQRLTLDDARQARDLTGILLLRARDWPGSPLFGGGAKAGVPEPGGAVGEGAR